MKKFNEYLSEGMDHATAMATAEKMYQKAYADLNKRLSGKRPVEVVKGLYEIERLLHDQQLFQLSKIASDAAALLVRTIPNYDPEKVIPPS